MLVAVVERLVLPEKIKHNLLPYVIQYIGPRLVKVDQGGETNRVTGVHITVNLENLFGVNDFVQHPESVPTLLTKCLAWYIRLTGNIAMCIPAAYREGSLGDGMVGVTLKITHGTNSRFPFGMIVPLLSHFDRIPGLTSLDISQFTISNADIPLLTHKQYVVLDPAQPISLLPYICSTNDFLSNVLFTTDTLSGQFKDDIEKMLATLEDYLNKSRSLSSQEIANRLPWILLGYQENVPSLI